MKEEFEQKIHEFAEQMYEAGFNNGCSDTGIKYADIISQIRQEEYQRGLNDAWECAKKIVLERKDDYTVADTISIFSCNKRDVLLHFSASEAIAKIKEYEERNTEEQDRDCKHCAETYGAIGCRNVGCKEGRKKYKENQKQTDDELCADFECAYNFKGECKNAKKCDDFKPITKNETPEQQIGKSCMNCKYHVTDYFPNPNFPCSLIRIGLSCTNLSAWESNVTEKLYSNEEKSTDDEIKKALEQEPCEDAISRETVLKMQYRIDDSATLATRDVVNVEDIEELPSIQPKVKTGHWYNKWGKDGCSVCNEGIDDAQTFDGRPFKYCPMCGARMVEPQESEDKE